MENTRTSVGERLITLELRGVSKSFGMRRVLSDVNLAFGEGLLAVFGPNGSGKTTLLRIIAGLCQPSFGKVLVSEDGVLVPDDRRRIIIGFAAPDISLYDEMTIAENLRFFALVRGMLIGESKINQIIERLGIGSHTHRMFGELSSGMKQRAKLASAVLHDPPLLLLDEPYSNMDEAGVEVVHSLIEEYRRKGTVVVATSAVAEAESADMTLELGAKM